MQQPKTLLPIDCGVHAEGTSLFRWRRDVAPRRPVGVARGARSKSFQAAIICTRSATLCRPRLSLYPQIVVLPQFHRAQGIHLDGMSHTRRKSCRGVCCCGSTRLTAGALSTLTFLLVFYCTPGSDRLRVTNAPPLAWAPGSSATLNIITPARWKRLTNISSSSTEDTTSSLAMQH